MAISLEALYNRIFTKYGVSLLTDSFFGKSVSWVHDLEDVEYSHYLRGEELIINSSLSDSNDEARKNMISRLVLNKASGLLVPTTEEKRPSPELIQFCNERQFPLLWANYDVSFIDILHETYELLLFSDRNEKIRELNLRNAIFRSSETADYADQINRDPFFSAGQMTIIVSSLKLSGIAGIELRETFMKKLAASFARITILEESNAIISLVSGADNEKLKALCEPLVEQYDVKISIGKTVEKAEHICESYRSAMIAHGLIEATQHNPLRYSELGIYQLLYELKDKEISRSFVDDILGKLITYDKVNGTEYIRILTEYMKNDCSVSRTAEALFFHRNTVKYKLEEIRNILGYDFSENRNRLRVMLALHLEHMI